MRGLPRAEKSDVRRPVKTRFVQPMTTRTQSLVGQSSELARNPSIVAATMKPT